MAYKVAVIVITDVATPKTMRRRFIEVRGLFCYDDKYDIDDVVKKASVILKQYLIEKGYDKNFVEFFEPKDFELTVGVMEDSVIDEFIPEFEFEVCDKKYNRDGGYIDSAHFPHNWVELSNYDLKKIVREYVTPFYAKGRGKVGEWKGSSEVISDFDRITRGGSS